MTVMSIAVNLALVGSAAVIQPHPALSTDNLASEFACMLNS